MSELWEALLALWRRFTKRRMTTDEVIAALDAFVAGDEAHNLGELDRILDDRRPAQHYARALPAMLAVIERYPDADLGDPGPLVHTLEAIPGYEEPLRASALRAPAPLSLWMVNRILNGTEDPAARAAWIQALEQAAENPAATARTKHEARAFLKHQRPSQG